MNTIVNLNTLTQRLQKVLKAREAGILQEKANELIAKIHKVAKDWKEVVRKKLRTPAISRGGAPHRSFSQNEGFPMMVSGDLQRSLHYHVTQRKIEHGITISIRRWYNEIGFSPVKGYDSYGERLNQEHPLLRGWKERTYEMLDERLRQL